jgi:hypothetical protein
LDRNLVWAISEFEETERCEVAGAAPFLAFAEGCAKDDDVVKMLPASLLDQLALIHQHAGAMSNANLRLPFPQESGGGLAADPIRTPISTRRPPCWTSAPQTQRGSSPGRANRRGHRRSSKPRIRAVECRGRQRPAKDLRARGVAVRDRDTGCKRFAQPLLSWNALSCMSSSTRSAYREKDQPTK